MAAFTSIRKMTGSLYWRISLIFFGLSVLLALAFFYITTEAADMYFQEASQKLNRSIAEHIAQETTPFVEGKTNEEALKHTFHNVMVLNPSIEVYLLDMEGTILSYFAPKSKVKLEQVSLGPVHSFINDPEGGFIMGDDPRNPEVHKVFSAAPVFENDVQQGYIYVVLASEEYTSVAQLLKGSYQLRLAGQTMVVIAIASMLIGLLVLWFLIRNLNRIISTVKRFQKGDHEARIILHSKGELTTLAEAFNAMADTTVKHIREIQSVEELRRELIANVSHDLRTPLSAIQGYAETLVMKAETLNDDEKLRYTNTILEGTHKIKKLVEDLFQLSKLETRQVEAHFESFSLSELLHDVVQKYELLAGQHDITIETKIPQNLPLIYADIALIDRVLQNLIDNALKYTPQGGTVSLELHSGPKDLQVTVADTGVGIPEADLPYIFDRYRKGKAAKEGVGLGLAIVKKILELHQTDISVQSKNNQGTSFHFALPTASK